MGKIKFGAGRNGSFLLESRTTNEFLQNEFAETMLPYQRALKQFKFMQMGKNGKVIQNRISVNGVFWQPKKPCNIDTGGKVVISSTETEPCAVSAGMEICSEMLGTCLDHMETYDPNGNTDTSEFEQRFEGVIRNDFSNNAASELLGLLMGGQYYSKISEISPSSELSGDDLARFTAQENACEGILRFLKNNIASCGVIGETDYTLCESTDDILALLERLFCCAREKNASFRRIIDMGYRAAVSGRKPIILVSDNLYGKFQGAYYALQNVQSAQFSPLTKSTVGDYDLFFYKGIPISPVSVGVWDDRYKVTATGDAVKTQFVALTISENIEFSTNYATEQVLGVDEPVSMVITKDPNPRRPNTFVLTTNALIKVNVVNPELLVYDVTI